MLLAAAQRTMLSLAAALPVTVHQLQNPRTPSPTTQAAEHHSAAGTDNNRLLGLGSCTAADCSASPELESSHSLLPAAIWRARRRQTLPGHSSSTAAYYTAPPEPIPCCLQPVQQELTCWAMAAALLLTAPPCRLQHDLLPLPASQHKGHVRLLRCLGTGPSAASCSSQQHCCPLHGIPRAWILTFPAACSKLRERMRKPCWATEGATAAHCFPLWLPAARPAEPGDLLPLPAPPGGAVWAQALQPGVSVHMHM